VSWLLSIAFRPTCFLLLCDITIVPFRPKSKSESQNFEVSWENKFQLSWKVSWKSFKWVEFQNLKPLPGLVAASGGSDSLSAANWCDWPAEIGDVRRCQVMLCATASLVKNWLSFSDWLNQHVSQCYIAIKVFSESNVHDPVVMMMTINCVARSHYTLPYLFCRCQKGRISPRFTNVFFMASGTGVWLYMYIGKQPVSNEKTKKPSCCWDSRSYCSDEVRYSYSRDRLVRRGLIKIITTPLNYIEVINK